MSERKNKTSYSFRFNTVTGNWDILPPKGVELSGNIYYKNVYNEQPALDMFEDKLNEMTEQQRFPDAEKILAKVMKNVD